MKYVTIFLLMTLKVSGQNVEQKILSTSIDEVSLYLTSALITRKGSIELNPGIYYIRLKNLSAFIDPKSIKIDAEGTCTIISVNHHYNYIGKEKLNAGIDSLQNKIDLIQDSIILLQAELSTLQNRSEILRVNGELSFTQSTNQLQDFINSHTDETHSINSKKVEINKQQSIFEAEKINYEKQLTAIDPSKEKPRSEIEIKVKILNKTTLKFKVQYLTANAGWFPKYNIRVNQINQPILLTYRAEIHQNTGEDWDNVQLKLSNADPVASGEVPKLDKWLLDYNRYSIYEAPGYLDPANVRTVSGKITDEHGEPLIGATLMIKGTTNGTVADIDGFYKLVVPSGRQSLICSFVGYSNKEFQITSSELNLQMDEATMLEDVVVTGLGLRGSVSGIGLANHQSSYEKTQKTQTIQTTVVKNQTSVDFVLEDPITIKSNAEIETIDLRDFNIPAIYEYIVVPKVDPDAFLIAHIVDWDQYNLLDGEANLYFENAFVGTSIIGNKISDTLDISLGRDKNVLVQRQEIETHNTRRILGSNTTLRKGYEVRLRNQKTQIIQIKIFDQIPIAARNEIKVEVKNLDGAIMNEDTGIIYWELNLEPGANITKNMIYEVKSPKNEQVTVR